jgi:nitrate/nitrite-specific signal transduction histidine kinase
MHHRAKIIGGDLRILDIEGGGTAVVCTVACDEKGVAQ